MFKSDCRTCNHDEHDRTFCSVMFCDYSDNDMSPEYCDCADYVPSDNLEYVEWSYLRSVK
jgi:hypothetical protein